MGEPQKVRGGPLKGAQPLERTLEKLNGIPERPPSGVNMRIFLEELSALAWSQGP